MVEEDRELEEVVGNFGLTQILLDFQLTEEEVGLHLHYCGLIDLEVYLEEKINTKEL